MAKTRQYFRLSIVKDSKNIKLLWMYRELNHEWVLACQSCLSRNVLGTFTILGNSPFRESESFQFLHTYSRRQKVWSYRYIKQYYPNFQRSLAKSVGTKHGNCHGLKEWKIRRYEVIFEAARSRFCRFSPENGHFWPKSAPRGLKNDLIYLNFPFFEAMTFCIRCPNTISFDFDRKISPIVDKKFRATAR